MTVSKNDITGDTIATKHSNELYRQGWERIFGKKEKMNEKNLDFNEDNQVKLDNQNGSKGKE
ncbi:MAG: hypothetical protein N2235_10600 [Fischerella sp.]|nr:hypothetical protein [Fischerella sp.]